MFIYKYNLFRSSLARHFFNLRKNRLVTLGTAAVEKNNQIFPIGGFQQERSVPASLKTLKAFIFDGPAAIIQGQTWLNETILSRYYLQLFHKKEM